jgi:putative phosphoribosyl transferase
VAIAPVSLLHWRIVMTATPMPRLVPRMFRDRRTAGRYLADSLMRYAGTNALVIGLPRGGVIVADEVARVLEATLDVWIARKLGAPSQPELGMGAVAEGPAVVIDRDIVRALRVDRAALLRVARRELAEVRDRVAMFRGDRPIPVVAGRRVIIVDDGVATGGTMRATIRTIKRRHPARIVVAVPVAAADTADALRGLVDEVVCLHEPADLGAVGYWYEDFRQVPNEEVLRVLKRVSR